MTLVAVVAHRNKDFGGGLRELRERLRAEGVDEPIWLEVDKSRQAPKRVRRALKLGAERVIVWGGDGMVQKCVDVLAGTDAIIGILPAGTANLFATNLGIPSDLEGALEVALHGTLRRLDVGTVNGEHFAVMAGTGFDARMIKEADRGLKDRIGQAAYVWTGAKAVGTPPQGTRVRVDGHTWFKGKASCVLVGNVGQIGKGVHAFADAQPDDGLLDVGVVTASTRVQWLRVIARMITGKPTRSKLVHATRGRNIDVRLDHKALYELDGGDRSPSKRLKIRVEPRAITVCVPSS
ncbi:MAG: Sphingosine kinase [Actinomycetia bacterium]|nr:Sphingosine kinase [Actinomycetes bacterium]